MSPNTRSLGHQIRVRRRLRGMTQQQLADLLDVHQVTVSAWERGTRTPTLSGLINVAQILGCSIFDLLDSEVAA